MMLQILFDHLFRHLPYRGAEVAPRQECPPNTASTGAHTPIEMNSGRLKAGGLNTDLFFIPLLLALYLPFAVRDKLFSNTAARNMVLSVAALIVLSGLAIEGAGAVIELAPKFRPLIGGV